MHLADDDSRYKPIFMATRIPLFQNSVARLWDAVDALRCSLEDLWHRHDRQIALYSELPELEEIEFEALGPGAVPLQTTVAPPEDARCPITRHTLVPGQLLYQCQQCGLTFSKEGWQFLKKVDRGRCCGCHSRNTIRPFLFS